MEELPSIFRDTVSHLESALPAKITNHPSPAYLPAPDIVVSAAAVLPVDKSVKALWSFAAEGGSLGILPAKMVLALTSFES
jgi:hypothetical protein